MGNSKVWIRKEKKTVKKKIQNFQSEGLLKLTIKIWGQRK